MNHLWDIRQALFSLEANWIKSYDEKLAELSLELGYSVDVNLIRKLYLPDVPHRVLPEIEGEYNIFRTSINGITIRFVEEMDVIQAIVEGALPDELIERIKKSTLEKISALENTPCELASY